VTVTDVGSAGPADVFAATPTKRPQCCLGHRQRPIKIATMRRLARGFQTEPTLRRNTRIRDRTAVVSETDQDQHNANLVRALYEASFAGDVNAFPNAMLDDFEGHAVCVGVHR
jgi:hypothetical protein